MCYINKLALPCLLKLYCNYEFVMFKCFVVRKNRNHGGQPIHSFLFLGEILLKPKEIEDI